MDYILINGTNEVTIDTFEQVYFMNQTIKNYNFTKKKMH